MLHVAVLLAARVGARALGLAVRLAPAAADARRLRRVALAAAVLWRIEPGFTL